MKLKSIITDFPVISLLLVLTMVSCEQKVSVDPAAELQNTGLKLSEAQMQLANIKIETAETGMLSHELLLTGVLKVDEQSVSSISSRSSGRIEKLHYKNTGALIRKGDALYDIYSEDLLNDAREFQGLHDNNWSSNKRAELEVAAENKLLLQGLLPEQIGHLNDSRYIQPVFTIYSPDKGIVRSIAVTEGEYVGVGQKLYELADDSKLWVEAQVYPNELQLLSPGMEADVIIPVAGGLVIRGRISFINPAFEPGTNITIVRTIIDNPGKQLFPGMLALLRIETEQTEGIVIPASSLLIDGQGYHIWIQQDDGTFANRNITVGIQSADAVLVLSGLEEGESVVTSGAYLLNSEKILKKSYEKESDQGMNE